MTYQERIDAKANEIELLTAYANGVTGAEDTNIGDAVKTLCDGFGGGDSPVIFYEHTVTYNLSRDTNFDSVAPSTASQTIKPAVGNIVDVDIGDLNNRNVAILLMVKANYAYTEPPTSNNSKRATYKYGWAILNRIARQYTYTSITQSVFAGISHNTENVITSLYGIDPGLPVVNVISPSNSSSLIELGTPSVPVQGSNTYFPVNDLQKIDSANTNLTFKWIFIDLGVNGLQSFSKTLFESFFNNGQ